MPGMMITWSAVIEGRDAPCVVRHTTDILSVIPPPGDAAAATALKWWLEDIADGWSRVSNWDAQIGDDETEATAHVMIHEPAELAGLYEVHAERKITARGYTAEPGEHQDVVAMLDAPKAEPATNHARGPLRRPAGRQAAPLVGQRGSGG